MKMKYPNVFAAAGIFLSLFVGRAATAQTPQDLQAELDREMPVVSAPSPTAAPTPQPEPAKHSSTAAPPLSQPALITPLPEVPRDVIPPPEDTSRPIKIDMKPGVTEIVAVAIGHLNRLVTPFSEPNVVTTSDAMTKVSGNVVYVSTDKPATLYITPKGDETVALGLALVPQRVPPREVILTLSDQGRGWKTSQSAAKAEAWEKDQPFLDAIRFVMRDTALGRVPPGYDARSLSREDRTPVCAAPSGVTITFTGGQLLRGAALEAVVGVVRNQTAQQADLDETWCATRDVVAIAYWPQVSLPPGGAAEIYLLRRAAGQTPPIIERPSLLGNGR